MYIAGFFKTPGTPPPRLRPCFLPYRFGIHTYMAMLVTRKFFEHCHMDTTRENPQYCHVWYVQNKAINATKVGMYNVIHSPLATRGAPSVFAQPHVDAQYSNYIKLFMQSASCTHVSALLHALSDLFLNQIFQLKTYIMMTLYGGSSAILGVHWSQPLECLWTRIKIFPRGFTIHERFGVIIIIETPVSNTLSSVSIWKHRITASVFGAARCS